MVVGGGVCFVMGTVHWQCRNKLVSLDYSNNVCSFQYHVIYLHQVLFLHQEMGEAD